MCPAGPSDKHRHRPPKVALARCDNYGDNEVLSALRSSINLLGGIEHLFKKGEKVLLKPNLLAAKPAELAVTTHPSIVRAAITLLREAGAAPLVGDSPGIGSAVKVAGRCGIADVCREMEVELIDFKESVTVINPRGGQFRRFEIAKEALEVDAILNLPKVKTHAQMFLTLGVKNLFGCVVGKRKPQWHLSAGVDTATFARMLVDLSLTLKPRLTIADGIVGMEGNGPGNGDPRRLGFIAVSQECLPLDTVISTILGAQPEDVPVLRVAREDKRGETEIEKITILGEKLEACRVSLFRFPEKVVDINFTATLPYFIRRRLKKSLSVKPHIEHTLCSLCNTCVDLCPSGTITKEKKITIDPDGCISCFCCQEMCPHGAITPKSGWLARFLT
ncbi:MAG: DUF362 domain-containing protein [Thermodesulfobacteriota bacterium]